MSTVRFFLLFLAYLPILVRAQSVPSDIGPLPPLNESHPMLLPAMPGLAPELGCWFISRVEDFRAGEYREFLDAVASRGSFELLSTSTRFDVEVTDAPFHDMMKSAARYARERYGVGLLLDLDVRLARRAFAKRYPDALQERLFLLEQTLDADGRASLSFQANDLTDHYTGGSVPYRVLGNRFLKAWAYSRNERGEVLPDSLRDVTVSMTTASEKPGEIRLQYEMKPGENAEWICAAVAFRYLTPDVFAPELIAFEKEILRQYSDVPLRGACKDEWGFPPDFESNSQKNTFWYSEAMWAAYANKYPGRELIDDCFLMSRPVQDREGERRDVIDRYNRLCFAKNVEVETEFAATTKEVFGPQAFSATHPTWWPWPDRREFTKNQLSWWKVPRDYAQTDECTPYFCRTSLAKGTDTVWYDMFYAPDKEAYIPEHWGAVLAGGRVNIHPLYPVTDETVRNIGFRMAPILDTGIGEARSRIRLLDLITHAPVDSPVAVVFGHFGAMNWARPEYDRVGDTAISLCNAIAGQGFPVDLTPSSQADSGLWHCDADGYLCYGVQRYARVVFFGETESDRADFQAVRDLAARGGRTPVLDFAANSTPEQVAETAEDIVRALREEGVPPQTAWTPTVVWGDFPMARPLKTGKARYVDGTIVWIAAENNPAGDEFRLAHETLEDAPGKPTVSASATGLLACRFDADGNIIALAAGALRNFEGGGLAISMTDPTDLALWRDDSGQWHGVIQAKENRLPDGLIAPPSVRWEFLEKP